MTQESPRRDDLGETAQRKTDELLQGIPEDARRDPMAICAAMNLAVAITSVGIDKGRKGPDSIRIQT